MTEDRIREIVREEIARQKKEDAIALGAAVLPHLKAMWDDGRPREDDGPLARRIKSLYRDPLVDLALEHGWEA